jgi:hypothetical protein
MCMVEDIMKLITRDSEESSVVTEEEEPEDPVLKESDSQIVRLCNQILEQRTAACDELSRVEYRISNRRMPKGGIALLSLFLNRQNTFIRRSMLDVRPARNALKLLRDKFNNSTIAETSLGLPKTAQYTVPTPGCSVSKSFKKTRLSSQKVPRP